MTTILWEIFIGSWVLFFLFLIITIILMGAANFFTDDFEVEGRILRVAAITWPASLISLIVGFISSPVLMF